MTNALRNAYFRRYAAFVLTSCCTNTGFQHIVMRMPRILSQLVVNTNIVIKNELLLHKKLMSKSPTFNP